MSKTLFDRLALHAATFEKIAEKNRNHHYKEVQARGMQAHMLAMDIQKAMIAVMELDDLRELAKDSRASGEALSIRIRNLSDYA